MKQGSSGRDLFKVNAITAGCLVALMAATGVQAQTQLDTVVVTGIRKGIEDAIAVKKNKDSIVESISAEDIGKLPDVSIAESISRLPGVTAQRTAGRAQQISIRGMAPDFATTLLNGREQVTTGDSRGVEFDQYPGELVAGVDIYKTPDGSLVGQGLAGTIDIKTARPLAFAKRTFAISTRNQKTGVGLGKSFEGDGDRLNFMYIDQFFDRKLGVALGWARFTEDGAVGRRFEGWGVAEIDNAGTRVRVPGGFNSWQDQTKQTRKGTAATVQLKPNKEFESTLDLFFSKFEVDKSTKGFQAPIGFNDQRYINTSVARLTNPTITGNVVTAGTGADFFKGVVRNDSEFNNFSLRSLGWNNKFKGDVWTIDVDTSFSNAKRKGGIIETTAGVPGNFRNPGAGNAGSISWTGFDGNNVNSARFTTSVNYADPNAARLTDVMGWGGGEATPQAGYSKLPNVEDDLKAYRLGFKRDLPEGLFFNSVELGLNQSNRAKTRAFVEGRLVIAGSTDPYASVAAPGATAGSIDGIPVVFWDPRGSVGSVYTVARKFVRDIANKDWTVKERVQTSYAKANIDSEVLGMPLRGNAGFQFVKTYQESNAFNVNDASCPGDVCTSTPTTANDSYNDALPSLNLVLDLGNDQVLRFGAAKIMARPTLNDMRASLGFGLNSEFRPVPGGPAVATLTGDSGNPNLKPFRANGLDLAYEKYWGNKAYVGVAGFYKDIDTYILTQSTPFNFQSLATRSTALPNRPECVGVGGAPLPTPAASCYQGFLTKPINGNGGSIKGFELSASFPFKMLWEPLEGFGLVVSHASTSSSINLPTSGVSQTNINTSTIPLPGLSKTVTNWQLYFERWGFQARVGQRKRSDFVGEVSDFTGDRRLTYIKGDTVTDAQIGYEFQSGYLKGLSISLSGYNIDNTPFIRYRDTYANEVENTKYGKTWLLGASYRL